MKCEGCREQFPEILAGEQPSPGVAEHLESCRQCQEELDSLRQLWAELGELPEAEPSAALRRRFHAWLEKEERRQRGWLPQWLPWAVPLPQLGWTVASLLLGVIVGMQMGWGSGHRSEIRRLQSELLSVNRAVTLSLLQHQSAAERLKAVSWSLKAQRDDEIVGALLETLAYDSSVNVRLAAVEALSEMADTPGVRSGLVEALPRQSSPAVQVALAELLLEVDGTESRTAVEELLAGESVDPSVEQALRGALGVEL